MDRFLRVAVGGMFSLWLGWSAMAAASGDIFIPDPPDTKRVPATIEIDWGPFAERVSRRHVVAKGETLRAIAARHYGEAKLWKAIAAANPRVVRPPDRVQAGAVLWVPPRAEKKKEAAENAKREPRDPNLLPRYEAFWLDRKGRTGFTVASRAGPEWIPERYQKGAGLMLLPLSEAVSVIQALEKKEPPTQAQLADSAARVWLYPNTLLPSSDPAALIVSRFRLERIERLLIQTIATRLRFDAEGKRVPEAGKKKLAEVRVPAGASLDGDVLADIPVDTPAGGGWARTVGIIVALVGLLLIVGVALLRSRSSSSSDERSDE